MFKNEFIDLIKSYANESVALVFWSEIEKNHAENKRHYHNLSHLENIYNELLSIREEIENWESLIFAIAYHDIIYDVTKTDNEFQSGLLAKQKLTSINCDKSVIEKCVEIINATAKHELSTNNDINLFLDADMAILGSDYENYKSYFIAIRKEYSIYEDELYNAGRTNVLNHFLAMPAIFKSSHFNQKYEKQARENIQQEIDFLKNA